MVDQHMQTSANLVVTGAASPYGQNVILILHETGHTNVVAID
jgi:hypothetical protein